MNIILFFKKNIKLIIIVILIFLLMSNKVSENFTTAQALDAVKATEKKVNEIFNKVDSTSISINKDIALNQKALNLKGTDTNHQVKYNKAIDGPEIKGWRTIQLNVGKKVVAKVEKVGIKVDGDVRGKRLCIGGTCIDEQHLQMLTGARDIGILSQKNSKYLSNWDWRQDSSRKGKKDKHGHYAEHVGQFRGGKGDWEKLRLVKY